MWRRILGWLQRRAWKPFQHSDEGKITQDEANYIKVAILQKKPECPDCGMGYFLAGPEGGMSQNVRCEHCDAEFNITVWYGSVIGERIVRRGTVDQERRQFYGRRWNI